jgi:hypothetical protein
MSQQQIANKTTSAPGSIAEQIALETFNLVTVYEAVSENDQFPELVEALLTEYGRDRVLTSSQEVELYDRVMAALPKDLQESLFRFNQWKDLDQVVRQEAGFLLGVQVGRRLKGEA